MPIPSAAHERHNVDEQSEWSIAAEKTPRCHLNSAFAEYWGGPNLCY